MKFRKNSIFLTLLFGLSILLFVYNPLVQARDDDGEQPLDPVPIAIGVSIAVAAAVIIAIVIKRKKHTHRGHVTVLK